MDALDDNELPVSNELRRAGIAQNTQNPCVEPPRMGAT
jgi:hypothetical protein